MCTVPKYTEEYNTVSYTEETFCDICAEEHQKMITKFISASYKDN